MLGDRYLLLEIDKAEAEFYHLPNYVPYPKGQQGTLNEIGFDWELSVDAMRKLVTEMDIEEYKPYKLFIKKWDYYKALSQAIKEERWKDAEKTVDKILSVDLLDPSAYLNLGFIFRHQGQHDKAEHSYLKGLELMPDSLPFMAGLAKTYEKLGKIDDAIYLWKRTWDKSSGDHQESEEAIAMLVKYKVYDRIEKRDPATKRKSMRYVPGENYEKLMRKEFQKNYNDIEALADLGLKLINENYTKLSIKVFERVYQLSQLRAREVAARELVN